MPNLITFTDLDGSLLDGMTYSYEAATPALTTLREQGIPLILVSSKTRAEMEPLRQRLNIQDPFIIEFGFPYHMLREVLKQIEEAVETPLHGFGDL